MKSVDWYVEDKRRLLKEEVASYNRRFIDIILLAWLPRVTVNHSALVMKRVVFLHLFAVETASIVILELFIM